MSHFSPAEALAFVSDTKLDFGTSIDNALEAQMTLQVIPKLALMFPDALTTWTDETSTPALVRSLIAMMYVAELYDKVYSDNSDDTTSNYAFLLRRTVQTNIAGILDGNIILAEFPTTEPLSGQPLFFPNDTSSLLNKVAGCEGGMGTLDDPANTDASFSMGMTF